MGGRLRLLVEASSVGAAALYGYGWVIASLFYGSFDVAPEEVGIGFAYVTIRVFFVVAAAAAVVAGGWWALQRLGRRQRLLDLRKERVTNIAEWALRALGAGFVGIAGDWGRIALGSLALFLLSLAVLVTVQLRDAIRVDLGAALRVASWAFVVVAALVVVVVTPAELADELADDVRAGRDVELRPLLGITLVQVDRVHAVADGTALPACVGLLGTEGGTTVLYDAEAGRVVRIPQERVVLTSPCP